jgi:hypothetical protein
MRLGMDLLAGIEPIDPKRKFIDATQNKSFIKGVFFLRFSQRDLDFRPQVFDICGI